ncbi:MAG: VWA domain-containing protein, partial [Crenarchaeota archaeon]|nr:VWA domain-containing protein [Thermoproteota archaeon]
MGFLDLAWSISFQKDKEKVKMILDENIQQPTIETDNYGFTIRLPTVKIAADGSYFFIGQALPATQKGKIKIGRLCRACVLHLTTHTQIPLPKEKIVPSHTDGFTQAFAKSLIKDTYVNAYLQAWYPDRLLDFAYANALAYLKIKPVERIFSSSTKVMTSVLTKMNLNSIKGTLQPEEEKAVDAISQELTNLRDTYLGSFAGEELNMEEILDQKSKYICEILEPFGPFLEAPSFRHTESIGRCSVYTDLHSVGDNDFEGLFLQSLEHLGGTVPSVDDLDMCWRAEQDSEALLAFNSEQQKTEKREKILSKIKPLLGLTRFKGVSFPDEDFTQYLRAKRLVPGASRRILEALREAMNLIDEEPRQEMGMLDLPAVIQALTANKPATDVFNLDEFLKTSFAWSIVLDVSSSMQVKGEYGRALAIAVAEAAREFMTDPTSWTLFGFSDQLYVLKAANESYSQVVRARLGGLKFGGLTYIPDSIQIAGKMLAKRFEEQRVLIVISDGWPYGYANMPIALQQIVEDLIKKGVIVIGLGVETKRMSNFFKITTSVYTQK